MKKLLFFAPALLLTAAGAALLPGCNRDADSAPPTVGTVAVALSHVVGARPLALDGTVYTTAAGETFTLSTVRYYLSNFQFRRADGSTFAPPPTYVLVDASKPATASFTLTNVPSGDYTGLSFVVGVDSTTTKSDPLGLSGDLNPANNMYWAWNSGHIFMKVEGSVTSVSPAKALVCHVGGYRQPLSAIVTAAPALGGTTLRVRPDQSPRVQLTADVMKVFDGPNPFALSTFPTTMMPSANSVKVAQNYAAGMFSVKQVNN